MEILQVRTRQTGAEQTITNMNAGSELQQNPSRMNKALILLVFLPCLIVSLRMDNDIWFLLTSGRYVLEHGIPFLEPFTLHQNFSFVMQQWLSAVIFWSVYSKLGSVGLIALVFVVFVLCAVARPYG